MVVFWQFSHLLTQHLPALSMQECSAGDSAAYQRRNASLDDVVIVTALRTPLTKVGCSYGNSVPSTCSLCRLLYRSASSSGVAAAAADGPLWLHVFCMVVYRCMGCRLLLVKRGTYCSSILQVLAVHCHHLLLYARCHPMLPLPCRPSVAASRTQMQLTCWPQCSRLCWRSPRSTRWTLATS